VTAAGQLDVDSRHPLGVARVLLLGHVAREIVHVDGALGAVLADNGGPVVGTCCDARDDGRGRQDVDRQDVAAEERIQERALAGLEAAQHHHVDVIGL
jgi:hypothetical protein